MRRPLELTSLLALCVKADTSKYDALSGGFLKADVFVQQLYNDLTGTKKNIGL